MRKSYALLLALLSTFPSSEAISLKSSLENLTFQLKDLELALKSPALPGNSAPCLKLEQEALKYTNEFRAQQKKPALKWHAELAGIARKHSEHMAKQGKLSHDNFNKRVAKFRGATGENVFYTTRQGNVARDAINGWINSPGHRANMLGESGYGDFVYCGIGIYKGPGNKWFATQIFLRPV